MSIFDLFTESRLIGPSEVRMGDVVATKRPADGAVIIREVINEHQLSWVKRLEPIYLVHRPLQPLPQSYGALIRITETDTAKLEESNLAIGSLLVLDMYGAWVNLMTSRRYTEEQISQLGWKQVWTTDKCPADQPS